MILGTNIKILSLIVLLYFFSFAQRRDIRFEHLSNSEGLSSNSVLCIMQDSRGFLWVGTYNGLNKYDGYNFTVYKNSVDDTSSISDSKIRSMCEDKNGNIWIGTWGGGLNKFIRDTEKFISFHHNPDDPSTIASETIFSISLDPFPSILLEISGLVLKVEDWIT